MTMRAVSSAPSGSSASRVMRAAISRDRRGPDQGADYVAFGGFFASPTKGGRKFRSDPEILRWWSETMTVPVCAIGGISTAFENCGPLVAAGADFLAVISAVWNHPDGPAAAVKAFFFWRLKGLRNGRPLVVYAMLAYAMTRRLVPWHGHRCETRPHASSPRCEDQAQA